MKAREIKRETHGYWDEIPADGYPSLPKEKLGKDLEHICNTQETGAPYDPYSVSNSLKKWRSEYINRNPALAGAEFTDCNLIQADFSGADLTQARIIDSVLRSANFSEAVLKGIDFGGSELSSAIFTNADLSGSFFGPGTYRKMECDEIDPYCTIRTYQYDDCANLSNADLSGTNLCNSNLEGVDLSFAILDKANLTGANLTRANLSNASLRGANLSNCKVHGVNVWNVDTKGAIQNNLIVSTENEPMIAVDNLQIAQFMYMLLSSSSIRKFIDTITSKTVLILGRFTADRKVVLDEIRCCLREEGYIPILFDFSVPNNRDITETVSTLAHLSKFIIADITEAKSVPQELMKIVPSLPSVPVQPILLKNSSEYSMFEHFRRFPWVLEKYEYLDVDELKANLKDALINPAEEMIKRTLE